MKEKKEKENHLRARHGRPLCDSIILSLFFSFFLQKERDSIVLGSQETTPSCATVSI
jgi:hypothetical protein